MDKARAAARQARAAEQTAQRIDALHARVEQIAERLPAPADRAPAELAIAEPPATAAQLAQIGQQQDALSSVLVGINGALGAIREQLDRIERALAARPPAQPPQSKR